MINRIKQWIYSKLFLFDEEVAPLSKTKTEKSCTRDAETRKRVAQAFEEQAQAMQTRAMKAHDVSCIDPWTCNKAVCYKWEPDKIVPCLEVKRKRGRPKKVR